MAAAASRLQLPAAGSTLPTTGSRGSVLGVGASSALFWSRLVEGGILRRTAGRMIVNAVTCGYTEALGFSIQQFGLDSSAVQTNAAAVSSPDGSQYCRWAHATSGNVGLSHFASANITGRIYPHFLFYGSVEDNADGNTWIGMSSALPTNAADPPNNSAIFRCRNGTDTNWRAITRDTATGNTDTTIALDTNPHLWEVGSPDGGTTYKFWIDGVERASRTTNVPSNSTGMGWGAMNIPITNTPRALRGVAMFMLCGNPADTLAFALQEAVNNF